MSKIVYSNAKYAAFHELRCKIMDTDSYSDMAEIKYHGNHIRGDITIIFSPAVTKAVKKGLIELIGTTIAKSEEE